MRTVDIHEAKTHLSRLVEAAANGEPFIIARAGKPLVKVIALEGPESGSMRRIGFLDGKISVPEDFDCMGATEIDVLFEGKARWSRRLGQVVEVYPAQEGGMPKEGSCHE